MLTHRTVLATVTLVVASLFVLTSPAAAGPPSGGCSGPDCEVIGDIPGGGGNGGDDTGGGDDSGGGNDSGGGGGSGCRYQGATVPCTLPSLGFFNPGDGCYYLLSPPPIPGSVPDVPPAGEQGNWYTITCGMYGGGVNARIEWVPGAPLQQPPDPEELARQALAKITLKGAEIGMAPRPGTAGLVNLPVWMWTEVTPNTWGPISASASAAGLTVTITAKAESIVWSMGDGGSVTCTGPGTAFRAGNGGQPSPTCGYVYRQPSRKAGGAYPVTATTDWRVDWAGGGVTGVIDQTRTSQTTVQIEELQVVNR